MYYVILFKSGQPHITDNVICGFYSEVFENVLKFVETIDYTETEVVIVKENDEIDEEIN